MKGAYMLLSTHTLHWGGTIVVIFQVMTNKESCRYDREKSWYLLVYNGNLQKESNSVKKKKATKICSNLFIRKGYIYSFYKSPVTKKYIEIRKSVKSENETPRYLWIKRRGGGDLLLRLGFWNSQGIIFAHRSSRIAEIRKNSVYASNILAGWVDEWRRVKLQSLYPASLIDLPKSCIV